MDEKAYQKVLGNELVVALGCTEPTAIALASALAVKYLDEDQVISLDVLASANIIKNAMGVHIPGTGLIGMNLAAALGTLSDSSEKLNLLSGLTKKQLEKASLMIKEGKVKVSQKDTDKKLYIEVVAKGISSYAKVIVEDRHTHVSYIEKDGKVILSHDDKVNLLSNDPYDFLTLDGIWDFIKKVDLKNLTKVEESITMNKKMGEEGLRRSYGLKVGKTIFDAMEKGESSSDLTNYAIALTAAGCDARMAGSSLQVMSNSGSGNQGLGVVLPVVAYWERLGLSYEALLRSVALSHLVTIYIKTRFGRLSSICGATVAAIGASCGITYLLGGGLQEIQASVQNMLGNITGMVCDGAKGGCALKVATCTSAACLSSQLAMAGVAIGRHEGIIDVDPDKTIANLGRLSREGGQDMDNLILKIMLEKENELLNP